MKACIPEVWLQAFCLELRTQFAIDALYKWRLGPKPAYSSLFSVFGMKKRRKRYSYNTSDNTKKNKLNTK
jgi:hypothetical protein